MNAVLDRAWLSAQLARSLTMLAAAWAAIPAERRAILPPGRLTRISAWPAQRHLYHLYVYERIVVDTLAYWLADGAPLTDEQIAEHDRLLRGQEQAWQERSAEETLAGLREQRAESLARLARADDGQARHPHWDDQDQATVAAECLQHTLEHTTTLLQLAIFWDRES